MIIIAASNEDIASQNIKKQMLSNGGFREISKTFQGNSIYESEIGSQNVQLVTLNEPLVRAQDLPEHFAYPDLIVFISRHSSESGTPTLSVHAPGNLGEAELGGIPRTLSVSPANAMRCALRTMDKLRKQMQLQYEVSYEGTHHGPSLNVPSMFVELGSSIKEWTDASAAGAVAQAAIDAIEAFGDKFPVQTALGIGGTHYNAKFTRIALDQKIAFGHMIPKYAIPSLDGAMLKQCIKKTLESVEEAILDWKGIKGENKRPLLAMLAEAGISYERV